MECVAAIKMKWRDRRWSSTSAIRIGTEPHEVRKPSTQSEPFLLILRHMRGLSSTSKLAILIFELNGGEGSHLRTRLYRKIACYQGKFAKSGTALPRKVPETGPFRGDFPGSGTGNGPDGTGNFRAPTGNLLRITGMGLLPRRFWHKTCWVIDR